MKHFWWGCQEGNATFGYPQPIVLTTIGLCAIIAVAIEIEANLASFFMKKLFAQLMYFILAFVVIASSIVSSSYAVKPTDDNITICHRTDSVTNPYNQIDVDPDSADGDTGNDTGQGDHSEHTGPVATSEAVAQSLKDNHENWGDIIPPHDNYSGLNWDSDGQAIWDNDCDYVEEEEPTPTPTPTEADEDPTPTVTPTPTESEPTPTSTPTPTVTPTEGSTPTPTQTSTNDGGTGGITTSTGGTGGSVASASTEAKQGEVLGASTMAATGDFGSIIATIEQALGVVLTTAGALVYGKKEKRTKKK